MRISFNECDAVGQVLFVLVAIDFVIFFITVAILMGSTASFKARLMLLFAGPVALFFKSNFEENVQPLVKPMAISMLLLFTLFSAIYVLNKAFGIGCVMHSS